MLKTFIATFLAILAAALVIALIFLGFAAADANAKLKRLKAENQARAEELAKMRSETPQ